MLNRKNLIAHTLLIGLIGLMSITAAHAQPAQPDSSFDDIPLNGLASFVQLRKEYYIGGLYLESLSQEDTGAIFSFSGRKRMDLRITIDKWSPRRFGQQWNQAILINNDQELLEKYADEILKFVDMMKDDLVAGDRITIDMDGKSGTIVYINNNRMFRVKDKEFFDVLLNTWIGSRPPSSEFKNNILTLPTDQAGTELLRRYQATIPTKERAQLVAKWSTDPGTRTVAKAAPAAAPAKSAAARVEPDAVTEVKARRSGTAAVASKPDVKTPVVVTQAPSMAAPKPTVKVEKPKIAAAKAEPAPAPKAAPKPEPKPQPKPAPKPEPKKVAKAEPKPAPKPVAKAEPKPAAKEESEEDKAQARLMRMYRSNVLKLTYLNTQYPKKAMDFKQEGLVILKVTINRKGDVEDIEEATSSEHKLLNKAARRAVQKSEPYPEIPKALNGDNVVVTLPFNFRL